MYTPYTDKDTEEAHFACSQITLSDNFINRLANAPMILNDMSTTMRVFRMTRKRGYHPLAFPYIRAYVYHKVIDEFKKKDKDESPSDVQRVIEALEGFKEEANKFEEIRLLYDD